jgi:hypothetical protein
MRSTGKRWRPWLLVALALALLLSALIGLGQDVPTV